MDRYFSPLKGKNMAEDRKENEMPDVYPVRIRALDQDGNSINTTPGVLRSIMIDRVSRYVHESGAAQYASHDGSVLCILLKKKNSNASCWLHVVALGNVGGGTTPMDATIYIANQYEASVFTRKITVVGSVLFGTCTYNGEEYYCLCDTGYLNDYKLCSYFYDGYVAADEFHVTITRNVTNLVTEKITGDG